MTRDITCPDCKANSRIPPEVAEWAETGGLAGEARLIRCGGCARPLQLRLDNGMLAAAVAEEPTFAEFRFGRIGVGMLLLLLAFITGYIAATEDFSWRWKAGYAMAAAAMAALGIWSLLTSDKDQLVTAEQAGPGEGGSPAPPKDCPIPHEAQDGAQGSRRGG